MSFVQPKTNPAGRTAGIGIAVAFHIVLIYALASGLGHKVVAAISEPLEAKLIEEVKPPPPPPKVIEMPPPPKVTPPPAFVPPPEVRVQVPPPTQPTITAQVSEAPPPAVETPPAPPAPAPALRPAPSPVPVSAAVVCSNYAQVMSDASFPREATRLGLEEGHALIQFTLGPGGEIKDIKPVSASHPSFARGAMRIVGEYKCAGQGRDVAVQVPFAFKSS